MDEYYRAVCILPGWLSKPLLQVPSSLAGQVHELRFRTGREVVLTVCGRQLAAGSLPECPATLRGMRLTPVQMEEIFYPLCGGSVHTHQTELEQGFVTAPGGCRAGIAGRFANRDGRLILQQITSADLRIARSLSVFLPEKVRALLRTHFAGMLIAGEPGSGKTTLLRQIAFELTDAHRGTAVVDERGELFPPEAARCPALADVLSGVPKPQGVQMALRTLSPEVILLDELGTLEEVRALEQGFFGGADFVASIHAAGAEDVFRRPQVRYLQQSGMLQTVIFLQGRDAPGQICEIRRVG